MEESDQGTEIERLRAEVAALKQKLDEKERTEASLRAELFDIRSLVDQLPVGVFAVDLQGKVLFANPGARHFTAGHDPGTNLEEWPQKLGLFSSDKVTHYPAAELPLSRALLGDTVRDVDVFVRNEASPDGFWLESHAAPLLDAKGEPRGAVTVFVDAESRRSLETEVATRTKELVANESEKSELIARLRMAVQELSTPILELWEDVLALPVIGVVDSRRSAEMMERLLDEIVRSQSRFVIIDLTGVEVIDTSTADHFMKLVKAVGLIGARCVLTGIRPAVAQTLVDLDVNFGQLETLRNLKHGLRHCLRWLDAEGTAHTR